VTEGEIGFRSGDRETVLGAGGYITKPGEELHTVWKAGTESKSVYLPMPLLGGILLKGNSGKRGTQHRRERGRRPRLRGDVKRPSSRRSLPSPV